MPQTLKYTITAQTAFDITVSWIFPDATTLNGTHMDLTALGQQILATVPALSGPQEKALLDQTLFAYGLQLWQGQLAAAAKATAQANLITALSTLIGAQQTVTQ